MLFMIYGRFKPNVEEERLRVHEQFGDHIAQRVMHLRYGGPVFKEQGGERAGVLYILEAADRQVAETFVASSPYAKAGLYETMELLELRPEVGALG